ncbi:MAG: hypothetical protein JSU64_08660 [candidate division WOR-3 bacterium]|nr:MAG: hypothetical protein JSU64_08660 [candidate division WOR-3 bacterium]
MNVLVLFLLVASNNRVYTSFYTYHRVGGHSVTDLYIDYFFHRYDFRLALEKRGDQTGLKSISFEIDSVFGDFRLALGDKPYRVRAPICTNLDLWGLSMISRGLDLFLGRERDHTASLPPTFEDNKYILGVRLHRQPLPRIPLDFYLVRRSDKAGHSQVSSNTAAGVNSEIKVGKVTVDNRLWVSHTEEGIGASYAFDGQLTAQKYGGHLNVTTMTREYIPLSSVKMHRGSWFRLNTYQKPTDWLGFSQDLGYTSWQDVRLTLNTRLSPSRLPVVTYGVSLSREKVSHVLDGQLHYKNLGINANYEWSREHHAYGIRLSQDIANCRLWSSFQRRGPDVWQFGMMFPFPRYVDFKFYFNYASRQDHCSHTTGFEISSKLFRDLNLNFTYEYIRHNSASDQHISFSVSKSFDFDRVGLSFISGRVFMDGNNNGIYDLGDKAIPDIEVVIDGRSTTKTDKNGVYMFSFVRSGQHSVNVNLGCMPAEIGTAQRSQSVDTRLLSQARIDFPLEVLGSLSGSVFFDNNNNGQKDEDEDGVPNVVLALNGYLTATDTDGAFRFANLAPGTYVLEPKVLPPETIAARQELLFVYIKPGVSIKDCRLGVVRKERPVKKKVFE